jgi:predicted PurR-regulated permease PerM
MLLLLAGLLYLVWRIVAPLWQPVTWAILLGALLAPATARLAARLGNRPRLASSLMTVAVVLLLLLPILALGGAVAAQAAQLVQLIDTRRCASNLDLADFPVLAGPSPGSRQRRACRSRRSKAG